MPITLKVHLKRGKLINTVASAGAWILADRQGDSRRAAGFFEVQGHS